MAKIKKLTTRGVDTLPAGFHSDGGNLFLRVRDTGARSWVFRYVANYNTFELGLGPVAGRSLAQARELAAKMRTAIAEGKNPALLVRVKRDTDALTFEDYALALIESKKSGWRNAKHIQQWGNTLRDYAYPSIGKKLPVDINLADVKAILQPIWATKTETATRLRQRIEAVLDYAAVHENDQERRNPARWKGVLDKVLAKPSKVTRTVNFAAAPYADVPSIMSALRSKDCLSAYCLRFSILTAARSGEARGALWSEIDLPTKIWLIPAARMKADRPHKVPLCDEAMAILTEMQRWRQEDNDRVFPGAQGGLLSDVAVNKTLHTLAPEATVHGFRSSFRQWGAETTAFPGAVLEAALAHVNPNQVEAAYQRSDLFKRRVELMSTWGDYVAGKSNVVQLHKGAA